MLRSSKKLKTKYTVPELSDYILMTEVMASLSASLLSMALAVTMFRPWLMTKAVIS
jgi:hypothetical protein